MVICIGILQLVRAIFSLYILHFTFYILLAPSALKWAGEGRGKIAVAFFNPLSRYLIGWFFGVYFSHNPYRRDSVARSRLWTGEDHARLRTMRRKHGVPARRGFVS